MVCTKLFLCSPETPRTEEEMIPMIILKKHEGMHIIEIKKNVIQVDFLSSLKRSQEPLKISHSAEKSAFQTPSPVQTTKVETQFCEGQCSRRLLYRINSCSEYFDRSPKLLRRRRHWGALFWSESWWNTQSQRVYLSWIECLSYASHKDVNILLFCAGLRQGCRRDLHGKSRQKCSGRGNG